MFGNLFSRPHEELLDHQSWANRNKRSRDELDAVDSDDGEGADFGGQRKAGRLDKRLGDDHHDDEGMGGMEQDGAQQGEGGHMVDVSWEEEERRQMMLMLTARQDDVGEEEAAAAGVDEEDQEAAGPTKEEMEAVLREAVQVVRQAREQQGRAAGGGTSPSLDEESEEASQDLLACAPGPFKSSLDPVALMERLLRGFKPLLQAGTRPMAQLQDLLHSLAVTPPDKARDSVEQVASELCNLQEELRIRIPYRKGALARAVDKSLASLKVRAAAAAAGAGPAGVVPAEGARKPDEAFEQQMEACNEVVDQLRTLDEAEERLEEYRRHYIERGQALVADKDAWIKTWQAKLLDHTTDAERAKKILLELDERFDHLVRASPSSESSSSSSLGLVSRLLDLTRSEKGRELVAQRQAAAEALEQREKKRTRVATNLRLVEGFIALLRVLCDGGKARLAQLCAALAEEVAGIRARLQAELQGQVAGAAQTLQGLLEFHEARKTRASKSAKLREHELRQHTSLFGQDTPTETQRLESCVKELRRVVSHSQMAIEKAMHSQHAFWARAEEQLPSPIALELAAAYRKQMANPPAIGGSFIPGAMAMTGADEGAAGAGAGMMMDGGYSPAAAAARRRSEGPLAEAVAQGAAVATQEQQRVAASEEAWASKHSPAKRDNDACAVM